MGSVCAVFEEAVELVYVFHGDFQALVTEEHILQTGLEIFVGTLQEVVEFVDMLQEDICDVGDRLLEMLVQEMHTKDDLRGRFVQGVEFALGVVAPVTVVCEVVRGFCCPLFPTQHLLARLDALFRVCEGYMARFAGRIEHRFLKGGLHG